MGVFNKLAERNAFGTGTLPGKVIEVFTNNTKLHGRRSTLIHTSAY